MESNVDELAERIPMLRVAGESKKEASVAEVLDDEPPLLEQMMKAAAEAKQQQQQQKAAQARKESKDAFAGAFKKGFLNSNPKPQQKAKAAAAPVSKSVTKPAASSENVKARASGQQTAPLPATKPADDIPTITARPTASSHVFSEVQDALAEEQAALLGQLKPEDWLTDDLMQKFARNPILVAGMQNPHMSAALQEFQTNPQQAMMKYRNHEPTRNFLMEFSRLMGEHFTKLGEAQERERKAEAQTSQTKGGPVREIGPLEQKALETHKANIQQQAPVVVSKAEQEEEERVRRILNDPELSRILMDPQVQRMIQECGDPRRLQEHMRKPESAAILRKLMDAGLVQIAR